MSTSEFISPHKGRKGLKRLYYALGHSYQGFMVAAKTEDAIRQELLLALVLIPLAVILGSSPIEQALMILSVLFLIVVELLNSALEATVDRIGLEHHELSGRAKDIGSAAVFTALIMLVVTWLFALQ